MRVWVEEKTSLVLVTVCCESSINIHGNLTLHEQKSFIEQTPNGGLLDAKNGQ